MAGGALTMSKKPRFGEEVSAMIRDRFPGVLESEPHAVCAAIDGLAEAAATVLSLVAVQRGLEASADVIDRHTLVIQENMEIMIRAALDRIQKQPARKAN